MQFKNRQNEKVKLADGREVFLARNVAVNALVLRGEYVLLVKRSKNMNEGGKWCLPCGYLDWDETPEQAVIRELYEETGVDQSQVLFIKPRYNADTNFSYISTRLDSPRQNIEITYPFYFISKRDNINVPDFAKEEVDEVKWVSFYDLDLYDIAFWHNELIQKLSGLI